MTTKYQNQLKCFEGDYLIRDVPINRLVPNRESITLIWYNPSFTESSIDVSKIAHLRARNDYILLYTQKSMCIEYLTANIQRSEHIIMVLFGTDILDEACKCEQIHAILIVGSSDKRKLKLNHRTTVEVFDKSESMMIKLSEVITNVEHQVAQETDGMFTTFDQKEISLRDLHQTPGSAVWCQAFKVMVKAMPHSVDAQQQMLAECRSYYSNNQWELAKIDKFEQTYRAVDAIEWYTKPDFPFKIINKALRTEDIVALYTFRYYITDLSASLEALRSEQSISHVYRGVTVSREEVEKYQVGHLVATNGFLSTSIEKEVAEMFGGVDRSIIPLTRSRTDKLQHILFEIIIDPSHSSDIILANIAQNSAFSQENEILFDMGTTFEIVSSTYDDEHHFWNIKMQTSVTAIPFYREYGEYIQKLMKETNVDVLFGILLTDMGEYTKTLKYFDCLLARMLDDHDDRANVYYSMSRAHRFRGEYEATLTLLRQAEHLQCAKLPESKFDLARTLAGIGSVYYEMHDHDQELLYYQRAMTMYEEIENIGSEDHIETARSLNRLGFAYLNKQRYTEALPYLTKALNIYKKIVPDGHPGIAQVLLNLGLVHHALGHIDQTLDFYQDALKQLKKIMPDGHLHMALPLYRLCVFYEEQQQLDQALVYAQRALKIREQKLPPEHRSLREVQDMVARLQKKLQQ